MLGFVSECLMWATGIYQNQPFCLYYGEVHLLNYNLVAVQFGINHY